MADAPLALQRGLRVLELVAAQSLSFTVLRDSLNLSDPSCFRLLQGLCKLGYLEKNALGNYQAGDALHRLRGEWADDSLKRVVHPFLKDLSTETGNTCLCIQNTDEGMYVVDRVLHEESLVLLPEGSINTNYYDPPWGWLFTGKEGVHKINSNNFKPPNINEIMQQLEAFESGKQNHVIRYQDDRTRLAIPLQVEQGHVIIAIAVGGTPASFSGDKLGHIIEVTQRVCDACRKVLPG